MPLNDPVPSTAADVLKYNAERFDEVLNSNNDTYTDRLGVERKTAHALETAIEQAESGIIAGAWVYPNVAAGEAARTDGDYFWVVSAEDTEVLELWLMGATTATDTGKRTVSAASVDTALADSAQSKANEYQLQETIYNAIGGTAERVTNTNGLIYPPELSEKYLLRPYFVGVDKVTPVVPQQVTITGKNIVNPNINLWESGGYNSTTGEKFASGSRTRTVGKIPLKPETSYSSNGKVRVSLFDSAGVFTREIIPGATSSSNFVTAANETQMAVHYDKNILTAPPAVEQIQIEIGGATPFERYQERVQTYSPIELFAEGVYSDTVEDGLFTRVIENRVIDGTDITTTVTTTGSYYRAVIASPSTLMDNIGVVLAADSSDGSYLITSTSTLEDRAIYLTPSIGYIRVEKTKIDARPEGTLYGKMLGYLNDFPITFTMTLGELDTEYAGDGALFVPPKGTVFIEQTGSSDYAIDFLPIAAGGGSSAGLDARVQAAEEDIVLLQAKDNDLQSQINTLVVGGDSSTEAAQARTSVIGYTDATLKARLDRMDLRNAVYVTDFGAVGDGVTDDTAAIFAARDFAEANRLALVFPPCADAYMLSRGVVIRESIQVLCMKGAEVRKFPAFTSAVTAPLNVGDTIIPVADASGFTVGYDVMVGAFATDSYANTIGLITDRDLINNTITISAYKSTGMNTAFASGAVASTTFAMFYTNRTINQSKKISPEFIAMNLDGNKQFNEPESYPMSPIFIDSTHTAVPRIEYCTVRNSSADGISDQSDGGAFMMFNRVFDCGVHGYHMGFTNSADKVMGNYAENCAKSGYYWCFAVTECMATNNVAKNCLNGFYEIDGNDVRALLVGNITIDCTTDYDLRGGSQQVIISDFLSLRSKSRVVNADSSSRVRISGMAVDGEGIGIELMRCNWGRVDVDLYGWLGTVGVNIRNLNATRSSKIRVSGNIQGCTEAPVKIISSDNCIIDGLISETTAAQDILIVTDGAQAASTNNVIGINILSQGVTDNGTGTKYATVV